MTKHMANTRDQIRRRHKKYMFATSLLPEFIREGLEVKLIVMYGGLGKSYVTKAFEQFIDPDRLYHWYQGDPINKDEMKRELKSGIGYVMHFNTHDIKEVKRELGIALSRRAIFIDMNYNND